MVTPRQLHFVKLRLEVYIFVSGQTTGFIASLGFFSYIFRPRFSTFSCHRLLHRSQPAPKAPFKLTSVHPLRIRNHFYSLIIVTANYMKYHAAYWIYIRNISNPNTAICILIVDGLKTW